MSAMWSPRKEPQWRSCSRRTWLYCGFDHSEQARDWLLELHKRRARAPFQAISLVRLVGNSLGAGAYSARTGRELEGQNSGCERSTNGGTVELHRK